MKIVESSIHIGLMGSTLVGSAGIMTSRKGGSWAGLGVNTGFAFSVVRGSNKCPIIGCSCPYCGNSGYLDLFSTLFGVFSHWLVDSVVLMDSLGFSCCTGLAVKLGMTFTGGDRSTESLSGALYPIGCWTTGFAGGI